MMCQRIGIAPISTSGFGSDRGLLADPRAVASGENHDFHEGPFQMRVRMRGPPHPAAGRSGRAGVMRRSPAGRPRRGVAPDRRRTKGRACAARLTNTTPPSAPRQMQQPENLANFRATVTIPQGFPLVQSRYAGGPGGFGPAEGRAGPAGRPCHRLGAPGRPRLSGFILLTGYSRRESDPPLLREARRVSKPFSLSSLSAAIGETLLR